MTSVPSAPSPHRATAPGVLARWGWPVGIILVLALSVGSNIWVMFIARNDPAFAVEPDYYRKAVAWDTHMAQERANADLGWHASATLALATPGSPGRLDLTLRDGGGQPVSGARLTVEALHNARASQRYEATFAERSPGEYEASLDAHRPGEWEVRLTAVRGTQRYTEVLRLVAEPEDRDSRVEIR